MQRIRQRRYGRDGSSPHATGASHVIKIGFDARELDPPNARGQHPKPGKLPGFLLCLDTIDRNNMLVVDMEAMSKLGATAEAILQAKKLQLKSPSGLLPTKLNFVITHDARMQHGRWLYPGTFAEEYETWGKLGRFCHGDGVVASRRQEDGTRKQIECVPKGREGKEAKEWCPYSVQGDCRARSRLVLCLFVMDSKGRPMPVSDALGWEARFRFDTASEYNPIRFLAALDAASDRLHGNLAGIPGTLIYNVQRKRTGNEKAPVGIVGQVQMALSEHEIAKRERELWDRQLEQQRVGALPAGAVALPPAQEAPAAEQPDDLPAVYVMGVDIGEDDDVGVEQVVEQVQPEEPTDDASQGDQEEGSGQQSSSAPPDDVRARVQRAEEILLRDFPHTDSMLSFALYEGYGAKNLDEVPDDQLEKLLAELRDMYRAERSEREGMRS